MKPAENSPWQALAASKVFKRTVMILLLAPVAILIVWFGGRMFSALIAFTSIVLVFEWTRIVDRTEFSTAFYVLSFTAISSIFLAAGGSYQLAYATALAGGLISAISERLKGRSSQWPMIGIFYLIMPCIAFVWIRNGPETGRSLTLLLLVAVWATDIGAYVFGKMIGGPLMAPAISPGKTWAGAFGGILTAMTCCSFIALLGSENWSIWVLAMIGISLSIATIVGDFAESALKRYFGIKDSGGFIPGHGGLLDRLDGMLFATAALALVLFIYSFTSTG
ncbi:phosphatidate cytidylyltransferase [Parvularcula sp. IMCC14364]|uniref:phosphatidate cytidylyltransferase n=1 Tax=Parvularcula sp. IMCC14364 TaxID=3067902 RepID=UPI0027420236|nr:phosphatidate cytidylyltransferase [Parvularcula sp. IMCC14364]